MNLFRSKTTTSPKNRPSRVRRGFILIVLTIGCFEVSPLAQAQLPSPAPDGGYPNQNTAEGDFSLTHVTSGSENTALGFAALNSNTDGSSNTATGFGALFNNSHGSDNTATGFDALYSNTTGSQNTAVGSAALLMNTGSFNTAIGFEALFSNFGFDNTAVGFNALVSNGLGEDNSAFGFNALFSNFGGGENTAVGSAALEFNVIGNFNTAIGNQALQFNTGSGNIALGLGAGSGLTTGNNNIDIGSGGVPAESNTIRIGTEGVHTATFIAGIATTNLTLDANAQPVRIDTSTGQLGIVPLVSSQRFKDDIQPMKETSEAILHLKPVTFRYKIDPKRTPQFGLVAEEVEKINPDLITRDHDGKPYGVRYEAVNAMLLNEFLKEHRTVQEQKAIIAQLVSRVEKQEASNADQQKQIEELTKGLQKVSAQVEMSKLAAQTVLNNQ